jgi:outer membrane protein assembly factor BamB
MLRELGLNPEALATGSPGPEPGPAPVESEPVGYSAAIGELPPVRRGDGMGLVGETAVVSPAVSESPAEETEGHPRRKRLRSLVVMVVLLALVGGGAWLIVQASSSRSVGDESELAQKAQKAYDDHDFAEAGMQFGRLALDFPKSKNLEKYRFLAELSYIRESINKVQEGEKEAKLNAERLIQFAAENRDDPLLEKHQADLHSDFKRLGAEFKDLALQKWDKKILLNARQIYERAFPKAKDGLAAITAELDRIGRAIAAKERRDRLLAYLQAAQKGASAATVQDARQRVATLAASEQATKEELNKEPEVKAELARLDAALKTELDKLPEAHRASIVFSPSQDSAEQAPPLEDRAPSSLVTPALEAHRGTIRSGQRPLLAQVRGVLYAVEPDNGQVRWAVRVRPEASTLPLRLPRTALAPEQVLALSPDSLTLSALDADTGATRWSRTLAAPCLGRPVVVGDRALVPTLAGRVEEIEIHDGALRGFYDLGQPLTLGGVHQPGTNLVYFAADNFCVYALDVARRNCAAVLYTGHPDGSLLSHPIALSLGRSSGSQQPSGGHLLLAQADGLDAMKLRVFALPVTSVDAGPLQEERLEGWGWFPPRTDGDSVALVTDVGDFAVFGIEPRADRPAPLFPRFRTKIAPGAFDQDGQARAQLVHAEGGRFWVLAHGGLHRLQATFTRDKGPHLEPPGPALLRVGSPLHAAQARADGDLTLYLATQLGDGRTCVLTAVDSQGGKRWQRQLGLLCAGQPVAVGGRVLAQDLAGRLFLFDADKVPTGADRAWCFAGQLVRSRGAEGGVTSYLLTSDNAVYAVAGVVGASGPVLRVREFPGGKELGASGAPLKAPLAGPPALVGKGLILLLANGVLVYQPLADREDKTGPNWRAAGADEGAVGYVVALGAEEFLVTDGSRGLKRMAWDGQAFETRATGEVPDRIVAPPVLLPREGGREPRVCVADSARVVTLLEGDGLTALRSWRLNGAITSGPFVRGGAVVCVVDGRKVVWLDPAKEEPLWTADFRADVVGQPQLIDGVLVVADQRGQIQGLNPATGKATGPGYTLVASAAPTAAPMSFGHDRLFVPLSDGTVLMPPRSCLHHPLRGFPLFR